MKKINFDKKHFDKCGTMKVNGILTFVAYKKLKNGLYHLAAGEINASNLKLTYLGDYELISDSFIDDLSFRTAVVIDDNYFNTQIGKIRLDRLSHSIPFDDVSKIDTNLLAFYL